jgi:hypothetical protein
MEYPNNYIATRGANRWVGAVCSMLREQLGVYSIAEGTLRARLRGYARSIQGYARSIGWDVRSIGGYVRSIGRVCSIGLGGMLDRGYTRPDREI